MLSCVIPGCCSSTKNCNLSFFEIPAKNALREKWIEIISNLKQEKNQSLWTPSDRDVVCSKHFCLQDFQNNKNKKMLNRDTVPSIFSNYPETFASVYKKNSLIKNIPIDEPEKVHVTVAAFCRLCGTKANRVVGIFDEEAIEHDIPNLIRMYLPIEVSINDSHSTSICYQCISALITWNVIYQQTLRVDRELDLTLQLMTEKDNIQVDPPNEVNFVNITKNEMHIPLEPQIQITEKNNLVVDHRKDTSAVQNDDPLFTNSNLDDLVLEEEKENSETNAPSSLIAENCIDQPSASKPSTVIHEKTFNYSVVCLYQCNICNDISRTQEEFRGHIATHRSTKSYTCNVCGTTFNLKKVMESHIRNTHSFRKRRNGEEDLSQRTCFHCVRKFVNKPTLGAHLKTIHWDGKSYICDICEHKFHELADFKKHVQETNHRTDGFISKQCEFCGLDFESRLRLRTHVASKHEGGLKCTICDITLRNYLERQEHEAIHPHLRPYKCEFCGKNFKRSCDYKKHLLIHSGEKPHVCEVCGKNFNRKHNMEQHRRSHYGDKPFSCPQCKMSFFRVGDLRKHKQLHYFKNQTNS